MKIKPKNWATFQHYKNRRPPWIKLHHTTLDDYKFQCLPDASRALAPCLWLLASEAEGGELELDCGEIGFRVHQSEAWVKRAVKPLIDSGLFISASKTLADCKQLATLETERETETETEKRQKPTKVSKQGLEVTPEWLPIDQWSGFLAMRVSIKAKTTEYARKLLLSKLGKLRASGEEPEKVLEQSIENSWKGLFPIHQNGQNGRGRRESPHEQLARVSAELISERRAGPLGGDDNGAHQRSKPELLPTTHE